MYRLFYIPLFLFIPQAALSQIDSLFSEVNNAQKLRLKHIFSEQRDSIFFHFDSRTEELFASNRICHDLPDTTNHYFSVNQLDDISSGQTLAYALMNNIVIASTGNLAIYSWDDLGGGSYHSYMNYVVFTDSEGKCVTQQIDMNADDSDVGYYRMVQVDNYYLALGYGTYGSGKQHFAIKILEYENGSISEISQLEIGSNRSQEINLQFDSETQTFTFNEYVFDNDMGFYSDEYQVVSLKFENGEFRKR